MFISFSIYSEDEVDNKIDELKNELEEYINYYGEADTDGDYTAEDDIYENITTDTSKEDKIYVYNLFIEDEELTKLNL